MDRILAGLFILFCLAVSAQAQFCEISVSLTDATCTDVGQCSGPAASCNAQNITIPCTDNYCIKVETINCNSTECLKCVSEAYLVTSGGTVITCLHTGCGSDCNGNETCPLLTAGAYRLYVCKIPCPGESSCETCSASCQARVTINLQ
jgi:hypothetical protein